MKPLCRTAVPVLMVALRAFIAITAPRVELDRTALHVSLDRTQRVIGEHAVSFEAVGLSAGT